MGEFDDKSGRGFQDDWSWPAQRGFETPPPRVPNVLGTLVLVAGAILGLYVYVATHWWGAAPAHPAGSAAPTASSRAGTK